MKSRKKNVVTSIHFCWAPETCSTQSNHTEKSYIEQAEMSSQHVDESWKKSFILTHTRFGIVGRKSKVSRVRMDDTTQNWEKPEVSNFSEWLGETSPVWCEALSYPLKHQESLFMLFF